VFYGHSQRRGEVYEVPFTEYYFFYSEVLLLAFQTERTSFNHSFKKKKKKERKNQKTKDIQGE